MQSSVSRYAYALALLCCILTSSHRTSLFGAVSLPLASGNFDASSAIFYSQSAFFIAAKASSANRGAFSLSRTFLDLNEHAIPVAIGIQGIAPSKAAVNALHRNETEQSSDNETDNPVFNQGISTLALNLGSPLIVLETDGIAPILGPNQKVCLIEDFVTGNQVATSVVVLNDSTGVAGGGVIALASNQRLSPTIFAAVHPAAVPFGAPGSGIALLHKTPEGPLQPSDAVSGSVSENRAYPISALLSSGQIAIDADATLNAPVDMHWDAVNARLYIALSASRASTATSSGASILLVGRLISPTRLSLQPAVALSSSNFTPNSTDQIFGFYSTNAVDLVATIYKVRTMHTSTGYGYAVVNGGVSSSNLAHNTVYALPLVQPLPNSSVLVSSDDTGRIASKNDPTIVASGVSEMSGASDPAALVGAGPLPSSSDQPVRDIIVQGDAVFVALDGNPATGERDATHESGIFYSTAIFGSDGRVARWTPWRRVMGNLDRVWSFGLDPATGIYMYLSHANGLATPLNTVSSTLWGQGAGDRLLGGNPDNVENGLVAQLSTLFPSSHGGVSQLFDFAPQTPSFSEPDAPGSLSVFVATGSKEVALIQSGSWQSAGFSPQFGDFGSFVVHGIDGFAPSPAPNTLIMTLSGGALDRIGPMCAAAISRTPRSYGAANGWLFVGGYAGLAVLSEDNGDGWDTSLGGGLKNNFSGITQAMSFKQLQGIRQVRRLWCDDAFLYVLTRRALVRIPLVASNFSTLGSESPDNTILATPGSVSGNDADAFSDMIISSNLALLATSSGLYRSGDNASIRSASDSSAVGWTPVLVNGRPTGAISHLSFVSASREGFDQGGMVLALAVNYMTHLAALYRFSIANTSSTPVSASSVMLIPEVVASNPFVSFDRMRENAVTDGAHIFNAIPKEAGQNGVFACLPVLANRQIAFNTYIPLQVASLPRSVGELHLSSASGAWLLPTDAGLQVQE